MLTAHASQDQWMKDIFGYELEAFLEIPAKFRGLAGRLSDGRGLSALVSLGSDVPATLPAAMRQRPVGRRGFCRFPLPLHWRWPARLRKLKQGLHKLQPPFSGARCACGGPHQREPAAMGQQRRIALCMGQDVGFCRDLIRGIRAYAIDKTDWVFQNGPPESSVVQAFRQWKPHGIIAQLLTAELAGEVLRLRKPVVDTSCSVPRLRVPLVDVDHQAVGRLAAEHFLERGYRHFGFSAAIGRITRSCGREFPAAAGRGRLRGLRLLRRIPAAAAGADGVEACGRAACGRSQELPKPVAILAANDIPARELADACRRFGLRVPDDVALLGVDNDDLECGLTWPPLSSVATPSRRIGYEAARLLDDLMAGKPRRGGLFLPPAGVVTRQSTDTLAIHDPAVVAALHFIRSRAAEGIRVGDVAAHAAAGRRTLETKFRELVGHTILEEIRRVRVQRVKQLLSDTDSAMPAVARRSGFATPQRMSVVFRQVTGLTPSAYRQQTQIHNK